MAYVIKHAIIGFNHGLPCYFKNMALGPQSRQKPRPTASVFVYLSPSGHVFNIAWQAMIKTYNITHKLNGTHYTWIKHRNLSTLGFYSSAIHRRLAEIEILTFMKLTRLLCIELPIWWSFFFQFCVYTESRITGSDRLLQSYRLNCTQFLQMVWHCHIWLFVWYLVLRWTYSKPEKMTMGFICRNNYIVPRLTIIDAIVLLTFQ